MVACEAYDLARFRQRLGLAHTAHSFAQIAAVTLEELGRQIDAARGKTAYGSYVSCIERYFLPYFGDTQFEQLTHQDIQDFELWCDRQMKKKPRASTLMNFASAWNRLRETGVRHGWISPNAKIPKLTTIGIKSVARPAFTRAEIDQLVAAMPEWSVQGRLPIERITRPIDTNDDFIAKTLVIKTNGRSIWVEPNNWRDLNSRDFSVELKHYKTQTYPKPMIQRLRLCCTPKHFAGDYY